MMNAEYRNAMLGFAPIQHSEFSIPNEKQKQDEPTENSSQ